MNDHQITLATFVTTLIIGVIGLIFMFLQYLHTPKPVNIDKRKTSLQIVIGLIVLILVSVLVIILIDFIPFGEGNIPPSEVEASALPATEAHTSLIVESTELKPTDVLIITTSTATNPLFPTFTPKMTPQGQVKGFPFWDDFDDGILDGWDIRGDGSVIPVDGTLEIHATSPTTVYTGEDYWHNYSVTISFAAIAIGDNARYGVVVRKSNDCQLYYISLMPSNNNSSQVVLELQKYIDCDQNTVSVLGQRIVNLTPNSWHNFHVTISGDSSAHIKAQIDDQEPISFDDTRGFIYSGGIGLRVEYGTIRFDNLSVDINK